MCYGKRAHAVGTAGRSLQLISGGSAKGRGPRPPRLWFWYDFADAAAARVREAIGAVRRRLTESESVCRWCSGGAAGYEGPPCPQWTTGLDSGCTAPVGRRQNGRWDGTSWPTQRERRRQTHGALARRPAWLRLGADAGGRECTQLAAGAPYVLVDVCMCEVTARVRLLHFHRYIYIYILIDGCMYIFARPGCPVMAPQISLWCGVWVAHREKRISMLMVSRGRGAAQACWQVHSSAPIHCSLAIVGLLALLVGPVDAALLRCCCHCCYRYRYRCCSSLIPNPSTMHAMPCPPSVPLSPYACIVSLPPTPPPPSQTRS
ncbi:hypothetical protein COCCADRAFT_29932 [Bipolaris zeicola 26-R-13]|uniref:Uncharacterized protein n=1 Tax=Cochliobolus carbonum (strain 26-R-13) TaxID=930089 RepID=W6YCL8_COCC2|nr:uncharacterized protein COCCADRAFT_29932 [Bipolaris zeicola 26-R-13]EUC28911.1 hypothetical protein COCCADRAFT_29932 [Bipolaris zeicola 26-R-13]